jgi:hypothetical protein
MSLAIAQIVDAYVSLEDRRQLEELQVHRRKLVEALQSLGGPFDPASAIKQNQDELMIIEAGIARLGAPAANRSVLIDARTHQEVSSRCQRSRLLDGAVHRHPCQMP